MRINFLDKRILNYLVIIFLTITTFLWTFFIFKQDVYWGVIAFVIVVRVIVSTFILKDFSQSWSKATTKTFLIKTFIYFIAFIIYLPFLYGKVRFALLASEAAFYLLGITFLMYLYSSFVNRSKVEKTKTIIIYGAGKAGIKLEEEFRRSEYKVRYFCDDDNSIKGQSIDGIRVLSNQQLCSYLKKSAKIDILVIAMPSVSKQRIKEIYDHFSPYFNDIKILPSLEQIFSNKDFSAQLKDISLEDLLARNPKDLDQNIIKNFIKDKIVLITGAGGSIGSQIARESYFFGAKELILLDNSEFNLYSISQELSSCNIKPIMQSIVDFEQLDETFSKYKPDIVIHAAAYKHVPLVEQNVKEAIINNIMGTKNVIDCSIKNNIKKFVLISTDKAVRPTNVMGTTKRICELYAQNVNPKNTEIVAVRFGNVLGSSGSVIPKFKQQIEKGGPVTVTHKDITRYFMLIPEACELVLQAASLGKGGEIFILDMGESVKIVDLAKKMIELSGKDNIEIEFTGLRAGEKLFEELLIDETQASTKYESITVAKKSLYDIDKLNKDIEDLLVSDEKLKKLKEIVPEFEHKK